MRRKTITFGCIERTTNQGRTCQVHETRFNIKTSPTHGGQESQRIQRGLSCFQS